MQTAVGNANEREVSLAWPVAAHRPPPVPLPPWRAHPRLWSLEELIRFCGLRLLTGLEVLRERGERAAATAHDGPAGKVPETERRYILGIIDQLMPEFFRIGLNASVIQGDLTRVRVSSPIGFEAFSVLLKTLRDTIIEEMGAQLFTWIPPARHRYFDQTAPFGVKVKAKFPAAAADVQAAGNCFAVDLHTATVFHLMRVAEHGLRALARKLKVKLRDKKNRSLPIEFADWQDVIDGCNNAIKKARELSQPKKQAQLEFFTAAVAHCGYMKDLWRNNVSHTRKPYNESEALEVMDRVRSFMVLLAERVP